MTSHSSSSQSSGEKPLVLDSVEIDNLLSMTLIANLGTIDEDGESI
jgi:hypothetical protein